MQVDRNAPTVDAAVADEGISGSAPRAPLRALSWLLRGVAGLLALAIVAVALIVHNAVYLVNQNLDRLTAMASEHFERKLTVANVHGTVFPRVAVVIEGLELASRVPGEPALLVLPLIEVRFRTDRALLSLGKELVTESVRVNGGVVHVYRGFDGEVDMADVVARLPPLDPKDIQGALLQEVVVDDVDIEYVDEIAMQVVQLTDFHLETRDAGPGRPFNAVLGAMWAGPQAPLSVKIHVDEVPRDLALWPFPQSTIDVSVDDVGISDAIATFGLPAAFDDGAVDLRVGIVNTAAHHMQLNVDIDGEGTTSVVTTGTGAGIEQNGVHGPIVVSALLDVDVDNGQHLLRAATVSMAGVYVDAKGSVDDGGLRSIEALVDIEQLARLGAFVPALLTTAPGAFTIAGAADGYFAIDGEDIVGDFDFDGATVAIGEALSKRPGEHLGFKFAGRRNLKAAFTSECGLFRAQLDFALPRGTNFTGFVLVPEGDGDVVLDLVSNTITLGEASSISPLLNDLFGKEQPGKLRAHANGRISAARTAFDIDLKLTTLGLLYDRTTAVGDAALHFDIDVDDNGLGLGVRADGTRLAITTKDEKDEVLFAKDNTDPIVLTAALHELGGRGALGKAMQGTGGGNGDIVDGIGLAPRWQAIVGGLQGKAGISATRLTLMQVPITDVQFALALRKGHLHIVSGGLFVFGGQVTMGETVAALTDSPARWGLAVKASALSASQLLAPIERFTGQVKGTIDIDARLAADGLSINALLQSLDGPVTFSTHDVHLAHLDIISSWVDNVWDFIGRIPGVDTAEIAKARAEGIGSTIADGS